MGVNYGRTCDGMISNYWEISSASLILSFIARTRLAR